MQRYYQGIISRGMSISSGSRKKIVMQFDIENNHIPKRIFYIRSKKRANLMPIKAFIDPSRRSLGCGIAISIQQRRSVLAVYRAS